DLFGKTVTEILDSDDRALFGAADAARAMAVDREVVATGEPRTHEVTVSFRGVPMTLLVTTTAWRDRDHNVLGVVGVVQDVTQRRRDEHERAAYCDRMRSMAAGIVISEERLRHA